MKGFAIMFAQLHFGFPKVSPTERRRWRDIVYVARLVSGGFILGRTGNLKRRVGEYYTHNPDIEFIRIFRVDCYQRAIYFETRIKRATFRWAPNRRSEYRQAHPAVLDTVDQLAIKHLGMATFQASEAEVRQLHFSAEWKARLASLKEAA